MLVIGKAEVMGTRSKDVLYLADISRDPDEICREYMLNGLNPSKKFRKILYAKMENIHLFAHPKAVIVPDRVAPVDSGLECDVLRTLISGRFKMSKDSMHYTVLKYLADVVSRKNPAVGEYFHEALRALSFEADVDFRTAPGAIAFSAFFSYTVNRDSFVFFALDPDDLENFSVTVLMTPGSSAEVPNAGTLLNTTIYLPLSLGRIVAVPELFATYSEYPEDTPYSRIWCSMMTDVSAVAGTGMSGVYGTDLVKLEEEETAKIYLKKVVTPLEFKPENIRLVYSQLPKYREIAELIANTADMQHKYVEETCFKKKQEEILE